jgi:hypothetical protein
MGKESKFEDAILTEFIKNPDSNGLNKSTKSFEVISLSAFGLSLLVLQPTKAKIKPKSIIFLILNSIKIIVVVHKSLKREQ